MSLVEQLQLAEVVEPAPISNWPVAPGWWVLLVLGLILTGLLVRWILKLRRRHRQRARSLKTLEACWEQHLQASRFEGFRQQANLVLKRHCLQLGLQQVGSMTASAWRDFLCSRLPADHHGKIAEFCESLYRPQNVGEVEAREMLKHAKAWIRRLQC